MSYRVADLFSGCGGFSLGFHADSRFSTEVAVDAWDAVLETYRSNFPDTKVVCADLSDDGAYTRLVNEFAGQIDVLVGGPPCQGFSTLGKRRDGDARSTLVDVFASLCTSIQPKIALVENVRGIATKRHPGGGTYADALRSTLTSDPSCNYICEERVLNAADFGVPQNRIRWFLLAVRADLPGAQALADDFWREVEGKRVPKTKTVRDAIGDLPRLAAGEGVDAAPRISCGRRDYLFNHRAMNHGAELVRRLAHVPLGGGLPDVPKSLLTPHLLKLLDGRYGSGGHVKNVYGRLDWDKPSGTVVAGIDKITCGRFVHPVDDRLLTPRECARLQSFPDWFRLHGGQVTQYYAVGNAVPPTMAGVLADAAGELLDKSSASLAMAKKRRVGSR